ncbi:hypothetical protein AB3S75_044094 [Citrus x aurantiifolia]
MSLMAPPQAHQRDKLARVGKEGFDILNKLYPTKHVGTLPPDQACYVHQQYRVYRGPQVITVMEPVIDSNQAAQSYGGRVVVDHTVRRNIRRADY